MRILAENTSAVLIDIQEKLLPVMHEKEMLEKNCAILIQGLKALSIPLIITQQYTKRLGDTIASLKALTNESAIDKMAFSCCDEPKFLEELEKYDRENVLVFGIESHVCVLQTAMDLTEAGYQVIVVTDCITSRKECDKEIALTRLQYEGAILTTYESILLELCRVSGTEQFKVISGLIK